MGQIAMSHAAEFTETELTMAQAKVIYLVMAVGELRMSELAARLGVTTSTATGVVDRLVELDLLVRHHDRDDRRHVVITTTAGGRAHLERMRELNQQQLRDLLAHIDDADLAVVERAIHVMSDAAAAARVSTAAAATTGEDRP